MPDSESLQSLADVCDLEVIAAPDLSANSAALAGGNARPDLLIEVPHGASDRRHYEATRRRLEADYPADLVEFFLVNTDVGAFECARSIARIVTDPEGHPELAIHLSAVGGEMRRRFDRVLIVRGLVARTFVDLNRVIDARPAGAVVAREGDRGAMTPGLAPYVSSARDREKLLELHESYQKLASRAYDFVLGGAGAGAENACGLILHTYAPRSVSIDRVDDGIVAALREAYEPDAYAQLPRRPDVDLITEASGAECDAVLLAPVELVQAVKLNFERIGIEARENATYRLDESTMGYVHSARYPGRLLCLEVNRELLVEEFTPFEEMSISVAKARRMAAPIAAALLITD